MAQQHGLARLSTTQVTSPNPPGLVDPIVLQTIILDEIAGRMADLNEMIAALGKITLAMENQMQKVAQGRMIPFTLSIPTPNRNIGLISIGDYLWWNFQEFTHAPAVSATIFVDGPSSCFVCLNNLSDGFQEVQNGEQLHFDYSGHALIKHLFLKVASGGTANLRIPMEF